MRAAALLVAAGGLALVVVLIGAVGMRSGGTTPAGDPAQEIRRSAPALVEAQPSVPPATLVLPTPTASIEPAPPLAVTRPVAPTVVAPPAVDPTTLERVEPRAPLSTIAQALPLPKPRPKPLLFRPVADSPNVILAGGRRIIIAGVDPVDNDEVCTSATGAKWPCGRSARAAFRGFLRGRAVTCEFPSGEVPDEVTASCRLGRTDIGAWLVSNGWGRPKKAAYSAEGEIAKKAGLGVYGPGPSALPAESATPLPEGVTASPPLEGDAISILPTPDEPADLSPVQPVP